MCLQQYLDVLVEDIHLTEDMDMEEDIVLIIIDHALVAALV